MKALSLPFVWWCTFALTPVHAQSKVADPWAKEETVKEFIVGPEKHDVKQGPRVRIQLLEPAPIFGRGGGPGWTTDENEDLDAWRRDVGDHSFLFTSEHDLFIDNLYAGKCDPKDDIRYGQNRIWVNGVPRLLVEPSKKQKGMILEDPEEPQPEGGLVEEKPWKIYVTPYGSTGSSGPTYSAGQRIRHGMTVIRVWDNWFHLHGVNYGLIKEGDEVRVIDGRVTINGELRQPVPPRQVATKTTDATEKDASPPVKPQGQ